MAISTYQECTTVRGWRLNAWPHGSNIAIRGDSGSWILNGEGDLIGLF